MDNSNVVQGGKFKVGDKVSHGMWREGHVVFGPFRVPETPSPCYLVENPQGEHFIGSESLLSAIPKFKVGQVVRSRFLEGMFKVVAGPFNWRKAEETFYVLEDPGGEHTIENEEDITPVVE